MNSQTSQFHVKLNTARLIQPKKFTKEFSSYNSFYVCTQSHQFKHQIAAIKLKFSNIKIQVPLPVIFLRILIKLTLAI